MNSLITAPPLLPSHAVANVPHDGGGGGGTSPGGGGGAL